MPTTLADLPPETVSRLLTALGGATDDLSASLARASAPDRIRRSNPRWRGSADDQIG